MVIRDPLPENNRSVFEIAVSNDKGKGKMPGVPKESEYVGPKSYVQTAIDLQIGEVE